MSDQFGDVEDALAHYRELIRSFIEGDTTADQFETDYIRVFQDDRSGLDGPEFTVLENLFFDVDDYVSDPALRDSPEDLTGDQLKQRASIAYRTLYGR